MRTLLADHPLVTHKLTLLRASTTDNTTFRMLADELVTLLAYEATRDIRVTRTEVTTPVGVAPGVKLAAPGPLIVPVLRAGIGMLGGHLPACGPRGPGPHRRPPLRRNQEQSPSYRTDPRLRRHRP
jgi:uracil phosphoribosyltransferase